MPATKAASSDSRSFKAAPSSLIPEASVVKARLVREDGGELGYATAWLAYQLRGDPIAAAAFTGTRPELVSNSNWPGSAVK